jgi:hypothetical protein
MITFILSLAFLLAGYIFYYQSLAGATGDNVQNVQEEGTSSN